MFQINDLSARFHTFAQAAGAAVKHAQQRGPALVRNAQTGLLLADFRLDGEGRVSISGVCEGVAMVEAWAAA